MRFGIKKRGKRQRWVLASFLMNIWRQLAFGNAAVADKPDVIFLLLRVSAGRCRPVDVLVEVGVLQRAVGRGRAHVGHADVVEVVSLVPVVAILQLVGRLRWLAVWAQVLAQALRRHHGIALAVAPDINPFNPCSKEKRQSMVNCKILLPKFNTWKPVRLEREKGSLLPLDPAVGGFSASFFCDSSQMASPLHRNGNAIAP